MKASESAIDTAIRETYEETGLMIPMQYVSQQQYICSIRLGDYIRKLFYYKVYLPDSFDASVIKARTNEIMAVNFYSYSKAIAIIQTSQIAMLWDGGPRLDRRITDSLVQAGWLTCDLHPNEQLYVYNYTERCKAEQAWNEVTMWCRGLVANRNGDIVARPLKKFFEFSQLYPECRPKGERFKITEKIDGFLGIMYWIDDLPYISTRDSFYSYPAVRGTAILYNKYRHEFGRLDKKYSYLFEIVFPNDYLILNYGKIEDLFLIDIIDNQTGESVLTRHDALAFPIIPYRSANFSLQHYLSMDEQNKEGFVVIFEDGCRIKIKFPWFKSVFKKKHGKEDI